MKIVIQIRNHFLQTLVEWTKPIYNNVRRVPKKAWDINMPLLSQYPRHSLGYALHQFLERENLALMPHYETHDVLHVLTGYGTTVPLEARMQCFILGNGRYTLSVIFTVLLGIVLMPEHWLNFWKDYQAGKAQPCFVNNDFSLLLDWDIDQVKQPIQSILYQL